MILKQSTAFTQIVGPILDSTGVEYTGAVIGDLSISKNGTEAAMASAATLTHVSNGFYTLVGTTGNSDTLGRLTIRCNKSTYQMPPVHFTVLTATAFDTLVTNGTIASTTSGRTIVTDAAGLVDSNMVKAGPSGSGTAQTTGDIYGKISPSTFPSGTIGTSTLTQTQVSGGAYALSSASFVCGDTRIANLDATVSSRASASALSTLSGIFTGITSLAQWLGLMAGKQTGNSTARTELRATGAGSGTYDETTDSQEAGRDALPANFSTLPIANMVTVFSTDFATNYDTTEHRWAVLARKIYDVNSDGYQTLAVDNNGGVTLGDATSTGLAILYGILDEQTSSHVAAGSIGLAIGASATAASLGTVSTNLSGFIATMPTNWLSALGVSAAAAEKLEDIARRRTNANVFASSFGDAVSVESPYGLIQFAEKQTIVGTTGTIKNPDGTTLGTKTYTTDAAAEPITGVS